MRDPKSQRRSLAVLASWGLVGLLLFGSVGASAAPAPSPQPSTPSLQQLFKMSAPAVVLITQSNAAGKWTSLGSGFLVSSSGVLVTNNHVIAPDPDAASIAVKLPRGDVYTDVRVIYAEARRDFAVLSIKATGLPTLKVGDSDQVEVGDQVVTIGNPKGLELTFTSGIVESVRLDPNKGYRFIQHQAPISPGSSGGPLLNMRGEVIGINTFEIKDAQNLNGAIPINYVKPYFGDAAKMTWQEYARASAATPPRPAAPSAPVPPSAQPAPSQSGGPGTFFESAMDYRRSGDVFKGGFAAGVHDTVSLFATAIKKSGRIDSQAAGGLLQCLSGQGDKLGQLREWVDSAVTQAPTGNYAVISAIARTCHLSFPGDPTFFESLADYPRDSASFRNGFAAGVFDTVSLFAAAAQGSGGIDSQKAVTLSQCLDSRGDKLDQLTKWVDTAMAGASPSNPAINVLIGFCLP